ncbi:MAG TPA: type II toxin-antitoxin system Phd/YefM family antitoxin [Kofleriaceae bacterium]|nr:type II toxin-antitoxin system Phd/YefM family antitoxin [Kofleriaceae bacterium]
MKQVNIAEAKSKLSELIEAVLQGDEVLIARRNVPVARLVAVESAKMKPRCGVLEGVAWMADDFDAPLDDFSEYTK